MEIAFYGDNDDICVIEWDGEYMDNFYDHTNECRLNVHRGSEGFYVYYHYDGCWHTSIRQYDDGSPMPEWLRGVDVEWKRGISHTTKMRVYLDDISTDVSLESRKGYSLNQSWKLYYPEHDYTLDFFTALDRLYKGSKISCESTPSLYYFRTSDGYVRVKNFDDKAKHTGDPASFSSAEIEGKWRIVHDMECGE